MVSVCRSQKAFYSALRRLRSLGVLTIWADAICIDQSDNKEKSVQVHGMGHIYKQATKVICDLGEADDNLDLAIELLREIKAAKNILDEVDHLRPMELEKFALPRWDHPKWRALEKLLCRPWFRRAWVKQELILSIRAQMMCGTTCFSWDLLEHMWHRAIRRYFDTASMNGELLFDLQAWVGLSTVFRLGYFRSAIRAGVPLHIPRLLDLTREAELEDERDKFYSILGLTVDADDPALYVSYDEAPNVVHQRVARRLIEKYGREPSIGIQLLYDATGLSHNLPSWALNWHANHSTHLGRGNYRAAGITFPKMSVAEDDLVVLVAGSVFDIVKRVSPADVIREEEREVSYERVYLWEAEAHALIDDEREYPTGQSIKHAYCTTLITDSGWEEELDAAAMVEGYDAFMNHGYLRLSALEQKAKPFVERLGYAINGRHFCSTHKGYFGLVKEFVQPGDIVCLLLGGDMPVVLRKDMSDGRYVFLGDCYVHGIMYGEALEHDDFHVQDFYIK